ncbi:hypothetical protein BC826DRAFT_1026401 [Russula brevipes]|nr:hypothetical protein BC826DRAFT_1026401 [Russula brevipes]
MGVCLALQLYQSSLFTIICLFMPSESSPLTTYFLDENTSEVRRLNAQYSFLKSVIGHPQVVPPGIDVTHVSRVLDVATGTGAWAVDFLSLPDVRDSNIQVFACDISTGKFPQTGEPHAKSIKFFQQDVTKPFSDELLGTFDLINVNLLSFALTSQGWKTSLQNLHSLLRPGGHLTIREGDQLMYNHEYPPPPEGEEPNADTYMQGTSVVSNANRIFAGGALHNGFIVGLSYHLQEMFEAASLRVLSSRRILIPFGNYCDFYKGADGTSLSKYKTFTTENLFQILNTISISLMKDGALELANGIRISSEEGRRAVMEEVLRFIKEGGSIFFSEWVVQRPFDS